MMLFIVDAAVLVDAVVDAMSAVDCEYSSGLLLVLLMLVVADVLDDDCCLMLIRRPSGFGVERVLTSTSEASKGVARFPGRFSCQASPGLPRPCQASPGLPRPFYRTGDTLGLA